MHRILRETASLNTQSTTTLTVTNITCTDALSTASNKIFMLSLKVYPSSISYFENKGTASATLTTLGWWCHNRF